MESKEMASGRKPTIVMIGADTILTYLFGRFAEQSGYQMTASKKNISLDTIQAAEPEVILFLSTDVLAKNQAIVAKLVNIDIPILVCTSATEETRARELGADYCLLHPLTYTDFQAALGMVITASGVNPV